MTSPKRCDRIISGKEQRQQIKEKNMKKLEDYVRSIPDFPEEGIIFRDVTSVLQDADGLRLSIDSMQEFKNKPFSKLS